MKAIVLNGTCRPEEMKITQIDTPKVKPGWVLIKIKAFGLNHAELTLRKYEADAAYIQKPIVPGIECVGIIEDPSNSMLQKGDRVVALMGGMGRSFNGSHAEYALLPITHVFFSKYKTRLDQNGCCAGNFFYSLWLFNGLSSTQKRRYTFDSRCY